MHRLVRVLVTLVLTRVASPALLTEPDPASPLWGAVDPRDEAVAPTGPETIRRRLIDVDPNAIAATRVDDLVRLDLFDDVPAAFGAVSRRRVAGPGRYTLSGPIAGPSGGPAGRFVLAVNGDTVAGIVRTYDNGATYRIATVPGERGHLLEEVDVAPLVSCSSTDGAGLGDPLPAFGAAPVLGPGCDDGSVIDVLVVYTTDARDEAGSDGAIVTWIDLMIEENNVAYAESMVETEMNLVLVWPLGVSDASSDLGALTDPDDGVLDEVHVLRDLYAADQVALVRGGSGGVANGLLELAPEQEARMFCVNGLGSAPSMVLSHELGHNMGCCHALGDGGGCSGSGLLFEYSNGHRFTGDSGELWRSVMAYNPGVLNVRFSNPDVLFDGQPTGVPAGEPDQADNARTINASHAYVATFRCSADAPCHGLSGPGERSDCNLNGIPDLCDIATGASGDVNGDGVPDECQDCDWNGLPDDVEIAQGLSEDCNGNGIPDGCEVDRWFSARSFDLAPIDHFRPQSLRVPEPPAAKSDVVLGFTGRGDFDAEFEFIQVRVNGAVVGSAFRFESVHCGHELLADEIVIAMDDYNALVAGGTELVIDMVPGGLVVTDDCPLGSFIRVEVSYLHDPPADLDGNGVPDACACPGDVDRSGLVDEDDLAAVLAAWGPCDRCDEDLDRDGDVGWREIQIVLSFWGRCAGP